MPSGNFARALACCLALAPAPALSLTVDFGTDRQSEPTVNAEAAFAAWSARVGAFTLDNLDGLSGSPLTSTGGNSFSRGFSNFINPSPGVLDGAHLNVFVNSSNPTFTWTPPEPVIAFGFFGYDIEGGDVTVAFDDGAARSETRTAAGPNQDSIFFGVSGLSGPVSTITIIDAYAGFETDAAARAYAQILETAAANAPMKRRRS